MITLATKYPFQFALGCTILAMFCIQVPFWIPSLSFTLQVLLSRATICLYAIFMIHNLKWWQEVGFVRIKNLRIILPYLPVIILIILIKTTDLVTIGVQIIDPWFILLGLVVYITGAFMEEAVFRGLVLRALLPGGLVRAAILSSIIFALVHFMNWQNGADLNATLLQVVIAFLVGLAFIAPLAVTRNIWPLVIVHAFLNFTGFLTAGGFLNTAATSKSPTIIEVLFSVIPFLLLAIYSLWLLIKTEK